MAVQPSHVTEDSLVSSSFFTRHWLPLILVLVVVTRLPFLWSGYGADSDCWLVAISAFRLWNTGEYQPSRLPGYPLHEFVSAPLVGIGGSLLSNTASLIITLLAVFVWARFTKSLSKNHFLFVIAFAFAPSFWQHSAETIDYVWSLLFILLSLMQLSKNRHVASGILLGIATGFRLPNIVAIVPILVLASLRGVNGRAMLLFISATVATTIAAYLPLLVQYGGIGWIEATRLEVFDVTAPTLSLRLSSFAYRTVYFIGPLTSVLVSYLFWKSRIRLVDSIRSKDPMVISSIVGVLVYLALFLWLPLERAYLLPALPFLLLLVDRCANKREAIAFVVLLAASSLVTLDVVDASNRRSFRLNIHPGMVIQEYQMRQLLREQMTSTYGVWSGNLPNN